jgi:hypothetical protein
MKTKTAVAAGLAALALPAAAVADKPAEPGKKGRDNAAAKRAEHQPAKPENAARQRKARKVKRVGFTIKGTNLASLPVTDGALTEGLVLDPTSANRHARVALGLTKATIKSDALTDAFGVAGDEVTVRLSGLTSSDALQPTDVVKVVGRVERSGKGRNATYGAIDVRRITITRETGDDEVEQPEQETEQGT